MSSAGRVVRVRNSVCLVEDVGVLVENDEFRVMHPWEQREFDDYSGDLIVQPRIFESNHELMVL